MNSDSIVLVTGANAGIGRAACAALAADGAKVVMACRSIERGEKALAAIRSDSGSTRIDLMKLDLSCLKSVEDFCEEFKSKYGRLDVLINNAGTMSLKRCETHDGFEQCFGVNYLGHFLLTHRLLDLLKESKGRIINVSSMAHKYAKVHFSDLNLNHGYNAWRAYAQSKLALVMVTFHLSKQLLGTGVTVNCLHPGIVATDIVVNRESGRGGFASKIQRILFMPPEKGAQTIFYLASSTEVEGVTGKYFIRNNPASPSKRALDEKAAKKLYEKSLEICGLK